MDRSIPQRELRNNVGEVLREAEAGAMFTITVRGRPVAQLGPIAETKPRLDVDRASIQQLLATPVDSEALAADLDAAEAPVGDPPGHG